MSGDDDPQEQTIADDLVVTKYKMGAEIANQALKAVVEAAKAGETVVSLCAKGDAFIMAETGKVFRKEKDLKKGIAFPTSVSVNNCVCHFSPLKSDPEIVLKDGDLVKIDLGVHVDGFISNLAHSFVVGVTKDAPLTGRKADVIIAAHLCAEAALRLVKPGNQNSQVTEAWNKIAKSFKCSAIEGMLSHQLKQHVIDGEKTIIQNPTDQQRKDHEKAEFEVHEVYAVDVLISTGEGKAKDAGQRTTIYKRDPDKQYGLKMKTSRSFFSEVERRFDAMPFTLRAFEDEGKARLGVVECAKHELLQPFNVLHEKEGEFVAQFKFTVLLMANGPLRITTELYEQELYKSEHEVEDADLKALLQSSASRKTQKKKKKKASKTVETETAPGHPAKVEETEAAK
ncbi:proliferation-associated protein 2G4 [Salmo salar]|uniref:Proliferation-associated 2G4, b n=3 Tax=Salmo TaxID=8028 RepID=A0A674EFF2_SALTR|nr:proliferation-associated protein 2G4 [Salmo salar]XP_029578398.1 proliferation-associated protein 2G4-like [Salmo trutta]